MRAIIETIETDAGVDLDDWSPADPERVDQLFRIWIGEEHDHSGTDVLFELQVQTLMMAKGNRIGFVAPLTLIVPYFDAANVRRQVDAVLASVNGQDFAKTFAGLSEFIRPMDYQPASSTRGEML